MKIGELAKRSGLTAHTLRFYEKKQLLVPQKSTTNQYREYSVDDLATAKFIKRCKASGFSLEDTAALLQIKEAKDEHTCAEAKAITVAKQAALEAKITELQQMVTTLEELATRCCGGAESAEFCSIIADLEARIVEGDHESHH